MISQADFTPETLAAQIAVLAEDPEALANAASRALSIGRPHATSDLADLVERIANKETPVPVGPPITMPNVPAMVLGARA